MINYLPIVIHLAKARLYILVVEIVWGKDFCKLCSLSHLQPPYIIVCGAGEMEGSTVMLTAKNKVPALSRHGFKQILWFLSESGVSWTPGGS